MRHVFLRGALTKQALACPFHACNMYFCAMTALTKQALACPFQACNVFLRGVCTTQHVIFGSNMFSAGLYTKVHPPTY